MGPTTIFAMTLLPLFSLGECDIARNSHPYTLAIEKPINKLPVDKVLRNLCQTIAELKKIKVPRNDSPSSEDINTGWKIWRKKFQNFKNFVKPSDTPPVFISQLNVILTSTPTTNVEESASNDKVNVNEILSRIANLESAAGIENTEGNIKNNAKPEEINPETDARQNLPNSKPKPDSSGNRDWKINWIGANEEGIPRFPIHGSTSFSQPQIHPGAQTAKSATPVSTPKPAILASTSKRTISVSTPKSVATGSARNLTASISRPKRAISGSRLQEHPFFTSKPGNIETPSSGRQPSIGTQAAPVRKVDQKISSNHTHSEGNTITDEDLRKLSEYLFSLDENNAMKYIKLNIQKKVSEDNYVDEALEPLLKVNPKAFQIPTIQKVMALYDDYNPDSRVKENRNSAQHEKESQLVGTFLNTNVMSAVMKFLADKGFVRNDNDKYMELLKQIWFTLFSRGDGKKGSNGFEQTFMAELKMGSEIFRFHNWIYFSVQEQNKKLGYMGYLMKVDLGNKATILEVHFKFSKLVRTVTTLFVGTSPELEMALYTVCFLARPDQACPVSLGGTKFNIMTHKIRYKEKDVLSSAYPDI